MPTFEVRRTLQVLTSIVVEAASEEEAEYFAGKIWAEDAKSAAATAEIKRQPSAPDDSGDARSEARYEQTDTDAVTERRADHRWGLGAAESPAEGTEA